MKSVQKLSKELPFIQEIENLKQEVDKHRPLNKDIQDKVFQKLRLDWNYNTNAIEGNSFTRGETVSLLMEGITAKGKPLKDALDIKGHNEAIDIVFSLLKEERELNEVDIRSLHKIVLGEEYYNPATTAEGNPTRKLIKAGQYKTSPNHVETSTGAIHYYASVEDTPIKMRELIGWYNEVVKMQDVNPVVLAALFHHRFVAIHPFDDGNGRMTRLLTNYILLKFGYPVSVVKQERRREYYATLAQADAGELIPIVELISETVKDSLEIYLKAIKGEEINEADDIDKEIELFLKEFDRENTLKESKSQIALIRIYKDFIVPFINEFLLYANRIDLLFYENEKKLIASKDSMLLNKKVYLTNELSEGFNRDFFYISVNEIYQNTDYVNDKSASYKNGLRINLINNLELNISWRGFVKNKTQNNYELKILFYFEKFRYRVSVFGNDRLSQYYNETPSEKERLALIQEIFKTNIIEPLRKYNK